MIYRRESSAFCRPYIRGREGRTKEREVKKIKKAGGNGIKL
jgi:hypothetical protein